jgi:copper chaperone CopZ
MKKSLVLLLLIVFFGFDTKAQFKSATIGIDGLTCSMCSRSVEKLILQLDFVRAVQMDLNTTTAQIIFKQGKKVNISELSKKVFDAGFSVRSLVALFNFESLVEQEEGKSYTYEGDQYIFLKKSKDSPLGEKQITFIGKQFISQKEFSHWKSITSKYKGSVKGKAEVYYIVL